MKHEFLFLDFETTGLDPTIHYPVKIAAVTMSADLTQEIERYHALVEPLDLEQANPVAMAMNGYDPARWCEEASDQKDVYTKLNLMSQGRRLAGHDVQFDLGFLVAGLNRCGFPPPPLRPQAMCTRNMLMPALAAGLVPSLSLAPVCEYMKIEHTHHEPMSDVLASVKIAQSHFNTWRLVGAMYEALKPVVVELLKGCERNSGEKLTDQLTRKIAELLEQ